LALMDRLYEEAAVLCFSMKIKGTSYNYWPEEDEWQSWAVDVYRRAVAKANGSRGIGPMYVCAWLSIRAGYRGWTDLFEFWAERAHAAGELTRDIMGAPVFKRLSDRLAIDERIAIAWNRFKHEYEKTMGYPLGASPLGVK
jgi:hypothetical protein